MIQIRIASPTTEPITMATIMPVLNAVVAVLIIADADDIFLQNKFSHSNFTYLYSQIYDNVKKKRRNKFDDDIQIATDIC